MPTVAHASFPVPKSWDEFENICRDSFGARWGNPNLARHGRQGQNQDGIDIYGNDSCDAHIGIQCKNTTGSITKAIITAEIANAEKFRPSIKMLYIATTCDADVHIQKYIRGLSDTRIKQGNFGVEVVFWGDIFQDLCRDQTLAIKHYPQFFKMTFADLSQKDLMTAFTPPQVRLLDKNGNQTQQLHLPFRRIRISGLMPDFSDPCGWFTRKLGDSLNPSYWRDLAIRESILLSSAWINLEIINTSNIYLTECTVQITATTPQEQPVPAHNCMPEEPQPYGDQEKWHLSHTEFVVSQKNPARDQLTKVLFTRSSLRPGDKAGFTYGLLLYFGEHEQLNIKYKVLAKELSQPAEGMLTVTVDDKFEDWGFEELKKHASTDRYERAPRYVLNN